MTISPTFLRLPKLHGLENDFLIHDLRHGGRPLSMEETIRILHRRRGVGADGILALHPPGENARGAVVRMVVHNADGSIAEMCGNGIRCAAKYLGDREERAAATQLEIETGAGVLGCLLTRGADGLVSEVEVEMGPARLSAPNLPPAPFVDSPLPGHPALRGTAISMGNPHLVLSVSSVDDVERLGPALEHHPLFPSSTNVEFVEPLRDERGLRVNVWERGSGFTRACGTGACAAASAWVHRGLLPAETWLPIDLPGGRLHVHVAGDLSQIKMRGPAEYAFDAIVPLSDGG